ncbi:MAG: hypothetical protein JJ896_17685 [Rhodothermales bacterium]|nr:hypothetical protein [Rhodothermales bacterium]MBO6781494.1 hypothetical protein [Rhodothermales bacterium]
MNRISVLLALFLAGAGCDDPASRPARVSVPSMTEPYELPATMCGDYFVVNATINGHEGIPLLMDSGAGRTVMDPDVLRTVGARKRIDSLRIGDYAAYDFGVSKLDMDALSAALGERVYGILGHPVFNPLLLTYDFPGRRLVIEHARLDSAGAVPLRAGYDRPYVRADVGERAFWILIDTGSSRGLSLDDLERFSLSMPPTRTGGRMRVNGLFVVETGRLSQTVRMGGFELEQPFAARTESRHLVGQEVLHHFAITFDHPGGLVRFSRPDSISGPIPAYPARVSDYLADPETGEVLHVFDESIGLRRGDRLVRVNGRPFGERGCPSSHLAPRVPSEYEIEFDRDGEIRSVTARVGFLGMEE